LKSTFTRWLPAIVRERDLSNTLPNWLPDVGPKGSRKAILGIAGLAFVGAGIGGPVAMASGSSTPQTEPVAYVTSASDNVADKMHAPSSKAVKYDYKRQPNFYYCGPAATRIALSTVGHTPSFDDVAKRLGTTVDGTNSAEDTTRALNAMAGGHFYKTHTIPGKTANQKQVDQLSKDVVNALDKDHAVVANIAGTVDDESGATHSYEGGHYLTVVGYANGGQDVKIADPADATGNGSYWLHVGQMANWIATRGYSA